MTASLTILCLMGAVGALLAKSIKRIPEGQVYTLQRRRRAELQLLPPGTHLILPLRDHIAHKISLTGRTLHLDTLLADDATRVHGTVYWQVLEPARADAVIDQADHLIREQALHGFRADRHLEPAARNLELKSRLNRALKPRGMFITRVDLHATPA